MGRFEPYRREDGRWDWRLIASNGETLCNSSQGYRDEHDVWRAIRSVMMAVQDAALGAFDLKAMQELKAREAEGGGT